MWRFFDILRGMKTLEKIAAIDKALKAEFHAHEAPIIELIEEQTHDPFCVLVGTILSARTKDACTAGAVRRLFAAMRGKGGAEQAMHGNDCAEPAIGGKNGIGPAIGGKGCAKQRKHSNGDAGQAMSGKVDAGPAMRGKVAPGPAMRGEGGVTPAALARLSQAEIEKAIYPVGFYRDKARHLKALPGVLEEKFGGVLPNTVEELCELPGVGRKTANLTVAVGFDLPAICVDVHVHRISNRLGLVKTKTPLETEMALRKLLPVKYWKTWNSHIVSFGQTRCGPIRPKCDGCPIRGFCRVPKGLSK